MLVEVISVLLEVFTHVIHSLVHGEVFEHGYWCIKRHIYSRLLGGLAFHAPLVLIYAPPCEHSTAAVTRDFFFLLGCHC